MADIFLREDVIRVLDGKNVVFVGDSVARGFYKDLVWLLNDNSMLPILCQKEKGEIAFPDFSKCPHISKRVQDVFGSDNRDNRIEFKGLCSGTNYVETRHYCKAENNINIFFVFVTSVWTERLDEWLRSFEQKNGGKKIDLVFMNSCLWDVTRWGPDGVSSFKTNLVKTLNTVKACLHQDANFFWLTTPVCRQELQCQALTPEGFERESRLCRFNVAISNLFSAEKVAKFGFNVIDLQYYSLMQTFRRNTDGVHWTAASHRFCTNLFLTFLCQVTNQPLPGRIESSFSLEKIKLMGSAARGEMTQQKDVDVKMKALIKVADEVAPESKEVLVKLRQTMATAPKKLFSDRRFHPYQHRRLQNRGESQVNGFNNSAGLINFSPWQMPTNPVQPLGFGYGFNPNFEIRGLLPNPVWAASMPRFCPPNQFSQRPTFLPNQFSQRPTFLPNQFSQRPTFLPNQRWNQQPMNFRGPTPWNRN